jgi:hypothetical protein
MTNGVVHPINYVREVKLHHRLVVGKEEHIGGPEWRVCGISGLQLKKKLKKERSGRHHVSN